MVWLTNIQITVIFRLQIRARLNGWLGKLSSIIAIININSDMRRFVTRQTFNIDLMVLRPIQREEAPCSLKIDVWTKICLNFSIKPSSTSGCFGPLVGAAKSLRVCESAAFLIMDSWSFNHLEIKAWLRFFERANSSWDNSGLLCFFQDTHQWCWL